MATLSIVNNIIRAPVLKQRIFKKILHGSTAVGILSQDSLLLNFVYKSGVLSSSTSARLHKDISNLMSFLKSKSFNKKGNYRFITRYPTDWKLKVMVHMNLENFYLQSLIQQLWSVIKILRFTLYYLCLCNLITKWKKKEKRTISNLQGWLPGSHLVSWWRKLCLNMLRQNAAALLHRSSLLVLLQ